MIVDPHIALLGLFLIFLLGFCWCILREQRHNPDFRFLDMVTGDAGRLAQNKFFAVGAFFGSFYAFVDGVVTGNDHTAMILAFSGTWAGAALINKGINSVAPPQPATTTTITTAPADAIVSTQVQPNVAG